MTIYILVKIGPGNGLLLGGTKFLLEPILSYHQMYSWFLRAISQDGLINLICDMYLDVTLFELLPWWWRHQMETFSA